MKPRVLRFFHWILVAAILISLGAGAYLGQSLVHQGRLIQHTYHQGSWGAVQTDSEALKLALAVERFRRTGSTADRQALDVQRELYLSRILFLRDSAEASRLRTIPELQDDLSSLITSAAMIDAGVSSLLKGAAADGDTLASLIGAERIKARNMTQFLLLQDSTLLNRERLTRLFEQMIGCVFLLMVSGATLVVLAIRQTKAAKASELEATAAREEASRQRDRLESALDGAADPFVVSDRQQRIVFANRAYRTLLPAGAGSFDRGTPLAALLAAEAEMLKEDEEATKLPKAEFTDRATRPGNAFVGHLTDGRTFLYRSHRSPEGELVLTRTDLSERMRLERERAEYRDQFHHAMKMEAVGRLAGGIAHDFNNVLTAILTFSEMLTDDLADRPKQQQMAKKVAGAAKRAAGLVKQILSFSRKHESDNTEVDVGGVVKETIALLRATTPQTMRISLEDVGAALIRADAGNISQVIMNLCVNARDAIGSHPGAIEITITQPAFDPGLLRPATMSMSPTGMPSLHIETEPGGRTHRVHVGVIAPDRPCVCLRVRDSGGGIRRAVLEHMFEPFYTTKGIGQGSGLGLAAVHGIVLGLEGTIAVETTEGVGTEFRIFLPMAELARAA